MDMLTFCHFEENTENTNFSIFDGIIIKFTSRGAMVINFRQQLHLLEKSPVTTPPQVLVTP